MRLRLCSTTQIQHTASFSSKKGKEVAQKCLISLKYIYKKDLHQNGQFATIN